MDDSTLSVPAWKRAWTAEIEAFFPTFILWMSEYETTMASIDPQRLWWEDSLPLLYSRPPNRFPLNELEMEAWRDWTSKVRYQKRYFDNWLLLRNNRPFWATTTREECDARTAEMHKGLERLQKEQRQRLQRRTTFPLDDHLLAECNKAHSDFMAAFPWYRAQYCGCESGTMCLECERYRPQW